MDEMTLTYTAPDGTVTVRKLSMDRWDEVHDRLEATGMCVADRKLEKVIRDDRARAKRA